MLDLGQIRSFAEVAERGTIAAAARALGYTAPAVSQHIARLEATLGTPLFDRTAGRLRLNPAGAALVPVALEMIDLEDRCRRVIAAPVERPHLVIAGLASALMTLVLPALERLTTTMTVELVEAEDADALRDLGLGHVDLVLTQEYPAQSGDRRPRYRHVPLLTDPLRLVLPPSWPATTTVAELGGTPWLLNGRGTRCAQATEAILAHHQLEPPVVADIADNQTLIALVAAGLGVTIVPDLLLAAPRPTITVADEDLGIARTIVAVSRIGSEVTVDTVIDELRETSRLLSRAARL